MRRIYFSAIALGLSLLAGLAISGSAPLFSNGFESAPWTSSWGMVWGPTPAEHASLILGRLGSTGRALRVRYPAGRFGGSAGGLQFFSSFAKMGLAAREAAYLRYYVRFEPGFNFMKGGKLPGLAGGNANTGGHKPNGTDGWSARIMWRPGGKVVQYIYHPDQPGNYGEDFPWDLDGQRYFIPGKWHCVETYVQLNTPGQRDGIVRSWFDGKQALDLNGIRFRDTAALKIDVFYFSTFFGGSTQDWAPPRDEFADFDDLAISGQYIDP